jgi:initiation factor 1A
LARGLESISFHSLRLPTPIYSSQPLMSVTFLIFFRAPRMRPRSKSTHKSQKCSAMVAWRRAALTALRACALFAASCARSSGLHRVRVVCTSALARGFPARVSLDVVFRLESCVAGDIVLVSLRDFQDGKCDVILKYNADEARQLKAMGQLPDNGACPVVALSAKIVHGFACTCHSSIAIPFFVSIFSRCCSQNQSDRCDRRGRRRREGQRLCV